MVDARFPQIPGLAEAPAAFRGAPALDASWLRLALEDEPDTLLRMAAFARVRELSAVDISDSWWAGVMVRPKQPPKKDPHEDPEQSRRFAEMAAELETAGVLNPTDGAAKLDRILREAASGAEFAKRNST